MSTPPIPGSREWQAQVATLSRPLAELPDPLPIPVLARPFNATIRPPGSKSLTNRALLLAALADGTSTLHNPLIEADDAQVMLRALRTLGARIPDGPTDTTLTITGTKGRWRPAKPNPTLNLNNAGTATRFLAAAALLASPGTPITIDGDARMRQRPIGELARALTDLGAHVEHLGAPGCPPLRITPPADPASLRSHAEFSTTSSSQFISALILIAPFLPRGLEIRVVGEVTSEPYVHMSLGLLRRLGVPSITESARIDGINRTSIFTAKIGPHPLHAFTYDVEADASGATYFLAAAALTPGATTTIEGVGGLHASLQGDVEFQRVLHAAGCDPGASDRTLDIAGPPTLLPFDQDLRAIPDTAMTAAVLACFAKPTPDNPSATTTLRGLRTLRVKETDRLAALQTELSRLGAKVTITPDHHDESLVITPPHSPLPSTPPMTFDTYHDHRMAMALALIGLRRPNTLIANPGCVAKTYPNYFQHLAKLYR